MNSHRGDKKEGGGPPAREGGAALARVFSMPAGAMPGAVNIQISGRSELLLEGCDGILAYEKEEVRLAARKFVVKITGRELELICLTADSALVQGRIAAVSFE